MTKIENYTPPAGWRIKSHTEQIAEGDAWSHQVDGAVHLRPCVCSEGRVGESVAWHHAEYLRCGGYVLSPIAKPQETKYRHFIVCDDPVVRPVADPVVGTTAHEKQVSAVHVTVDALNRTSRDQPLPIVGYTYTDGTTESFPETGLSVQSAIKNKTDDLQWEYDSPKPHGMLYTAEEHAEFADDPHASFLAKAKEYDEAEAATRAPKMDHLYTLSPHERYKGWAARDREYHAGDVKKLRDSVWQDALAAFAADTTTSHPEQVPMAGGKAASSKIPPLHLIPTVALESLADRFQLGIERKGDKSWNALSPNQEILTDVQFAIDRCGHVMLHAMKLRDKLLAGGVGVDAMGDASAVSWGGMFLSCVVDAMAKAKKESK